MNIEKGESISAEAIRSPEEIVRIKEKMRFISSSFTGNFNVRVLPGQGWACSLPEAVKTLKLADIDLDQIDPKLLRPDRLSYPEQDLYERDEDYIFGVLRHEIAEMKFSDFRALLSGQKMALEEGYKPEDYHTLFNATNDCRINNLEAAGSKTAKERLAGIYEEDLGSFFEKVQEAPVPLQYAALTMSRWASDFTKIEALKDLEAKIANQAVLDTFKKTFPALERVFQAGGKEHAKILQEEIWPQYKNLIEQYIEEEAKKEYQAKQAQAQPGQPQEDQTGETQEEMDFNDLPEEQKESYRQIAREKLSEAEQDFNQKTGSRSIETFQDENGEPQIRFKEISQEEIKKAEQEEETLTQEEKQQLEKNRQESEKRARILKGQASILRERKTGLSEGEQQLYNQHRQKIESYIKRLVRDIERTFPPKKELGWTTGKPRGARIDPKRLAREVVTEHGHFFKSREIQEIRTAAFTLLVDVSGSMYNRGRIPPAVETSIMMAEAFSRKNIPFEILVFAGHPLELKKFDEDYKGIAKKKIIGMLSQGQESGFYGATDSGFSLDFAAKRLEQKTLQEKIPGCLIMVTDGQPEPITEHSGAEWDLGDLASKWQKTFPVIGIGIGQEIAGNIENYFGREFAVAEPEVSRLPSRLLEVLRHQFERIKIIE
jgi:hypothetical protein